MKLSQKENFQFSKYPYTEQGTAMGLRNYFAIWNQWNFMNILQHGIGHC